MSGSPKTKINKENLRREIAADLGIKIDADDPLLLAAHIAAIVTRDTIAQERENNEDNQLLSYGDVRTVLLDVRDETIKVTDQIVGIVWMKIQNGLEERVAQLGSSDSYRALSKRSFGTFILGLLLGVALSLSFSEASIF